MFFSSFSIAITSLGEESAFRTFVRFARVLYCLFPLPLGVWEGQRLVIVALPELVSCRFSCSYLPLMPFHLFCFIGVVLSNVQIVYSFLLLRVFEQGQHSFIRVFPAKITAGRVV